MKRILLTFAKFIVALGLVILFSFVFSMVRQYGLLLLLIFANVVYYFVLHTRYSELSDRQNWMYDEFRKSKDKPQLTFRYKIDEDSNELILLLENISSSPAYFLKIIQMAPYGYWEKSTFSNLLGVMRSVRIDIRESPKAICAIYQDIHKRKYVVVIAGNQIAGDTFDWRFNEMVLDGFTITKTELEILDKMEVYD